MRRRILGPMLPAVLALCAAGVAPQATQAADFADGYTWMDSVTKVDTVARTSTDGIDIRDVLKPLGRLVDSDGNQVLSYAKVVGNVPVFGEKKVVVYPANSETPLIVSGAETLQLNVEELRQATQRQAAPAITLETAQRIASQELRSSDSYLGTGEADGWVSQPEIVMYRNVEGALRLSHHITMPAQQQGIPTVRDVFIDANDGSVLAAYSTIYDIEDPFQPEAQPNTQVLEEEDPQPDPTPPPPPPQIMGTGINLSSDEVVEFPVSESGAQFELFDNRRDLRIFDKSLQNKSLDADKNWDAKGELRGDNQRAEVHLYQNFHKVLDYFKTRFDFSWNGTTKAVAHATDPRTGAGNFNNAYFHPWYDAFFFGDGSGDENGFDYLVKALDVAAHEFGHGYISEKGPLVYSFESGALNEHIADLFGAAIDDDDWLMGEEITLGASAGMGLRNMQDPTAGEASSLADGMTYAQWREINTDRPIGGRIYPNHVSKAIVCSSGEDNGGVHINSSIFNRFAYLAATGDGLSGDGLGRQLLVDVYSRAMTSGLYSSGASFKEFRDALFVAAALQLHDHPERDVHLRTMIEAFLAIGL